MTATEFKAKCLGVLDDVAETGEPVFDATVWEAVSEGARGWCRYSPDGRRGS